LLERPDGQIWGFGGTSHMGIANGHVARVEPGRPSRVLYDQKVMFGLGSTQEAAQKQAQLLERRPIGPISHLIGLEGEGVLMTSGSYVFETDARLSKWRRLARLELETPAGRPDAVGSYPGVRSWARVGGRFLLTTARDGLARFDATTGTVRSYRLEGQPRSTDVSKCGFEGRHPQWTSVELDRRQVAVSDTLSIDTGHWLLALGSALVKYDVASGRGSRLEPAGLDGEVHRLARDEKGRIWLAGRGLWLLDGFARAVNVLGAVPAAVDTDVCGLGARGSRLSLTFSDRGAAMVDADALTASAVAGRRTALAVEDRPRAHEAHFGDHAVFVSLQPPVPWPKSQSWEGRFDQAISKVLSALDRSGLRAVLADDGFEHREPLILYTNDTAAVISVVEKVLRAESLWDHVLVMKRAGGQHVPAVVVKSARSGVPMDQAGASSSP
jgi:hypothetical protein